MKAAGLLAAPTLWAAALLQPGHVPRSKVHLLFIQTDASYVSGSSELLMPAHEVWQRWYEDGRIKFNVTERETLTEADRAALRADLVSTSSFLTGSVHVFSESLEAVQRSVATWLSGETYKLDHDSLQDAHFSDQLPQWREHWLIRSFSSAKVPSIWARVAAALTNALKNDTQSTHFVVLPGDTVPLKTMDVFWAELQVDKRSRFSLIADALDPYMILSRPHAEVVAHKSAEWLRTDDPQRALLDLLLNVTGVSLTDRHSTTFAVGRSREARFENVTSTVFGKRIWSPVEERQGAIFGPEPVVFERFVGSIDLDEDCWGQRPRPPKSVCEKMSSLRYGLLKHLAERKGVWVIRDLSSDTEVVGCEMTEIEYYTHWVRIGAGDGEFVGVQPKQRLKHLEETQNRLSSRCSLLQAMRQLLLLKASRRDEDYWEHGHRTVPRGHSGWYSGWVD